MEGDPFSNLQRLKFAQPRLLGAFYKLRKTPPKLVLTSVHVNVQHIFSSILVINCFTSSDDCSFPGSLIFFHGSCTASWNKISSIIPGIRATGLKLRLPRARSTVVPDG